MRDRLGGVFAFVFLAESESSELSFFPFLAISEIYIKVFYCERGFKFGKVNMPDFDASNRIASKTF
jgi:hypothetical protein